MSGCLLTLLTLCSAKGPLHLQSLVVLLEGEMLLLPTGAADLSHHSKVTSLVCDGLMPFVGFLSRSYQNTERLIKSRKENQLLL